MTKRTLALLIAAAGLTAMAVAAAATARTRPVLLTIEPDPAMVRPRTYCVMNPFRDRSTERVAERFLRALAKGDVGVLSIVDPSSRGRFAEAESKWPIRSWRIGELEQEQDRTKIMYWVKRGNGYSRNGYEESVRVTVRENQVVDFNAMY